jgi:hypothetical protein
VTIGDHTSPLAGRLARHVYRRKTSLLFARTFGTFGREYSPLSR